MSVDHHTGKGYTPLPQSISNTDTEDEEEHLTRINDTAYKIDNSATTAELHSNHENNMFYPLNETRNLGNSATNRQSTIKCYSDNIPIMVIEENDQNNFWNRRDMSPIRRFYLFASVLLCVVTIIFFLYILPCDSSMVCPSVIEPQTSISWDKTLHDVEIHGPITIVPGSPYNLILLLRGEQRKENVTKDATIRQRQISPGEGGVMSMQGSSGLPLWLVPLKSFPTIIDCVSIDIDQSGNPDCIVAGEDGLLVSIEPIAGTIHWSSMTHTFPKLPVILPDINSDGVEDLLSVAVDSASATCLVLLSGKTGQLLGRYSAINCSSVDIYNLVSNSSISYSCYDNNAKYVTRFMSLNGLLHGVKIRQMHQKLAAQFTASPRLFQVAKLYNEEYSWKLTPYHHLTVENEGTCPGQLCRASVNLTLQKLTNESIVIWDHVSSNAFASKPAFLVTSDKPYTSGFAIKFWQWTDTSTSGRVEKAAVTERRLIEQVLLVFVNYTEVQTINTSQSDVTQLCYGPDCQPDLNSRKYFSSIAVGRVEHNEFPELISYWSSYTDVTKGLTSKVQVIKMDSIMTNPPHGNA